MATEDDIYTFPTYTVSTEGGKSGFPAGSFSGKYSVNALAEMLAVGGFLANAVGGGVNALKGPDTATVDIRALATELFGVQSDLLKDILAVESELLLPYNKLRQEIDRDNWAAGTGALEEFLPVLNKIAQESEDSEVQSKVNRIIRHAPDYEMAARETDSFRAFESTLGSLARTMPLAEWQAQTGGTAKEHRAYLAEIKRDREPAAARGGDFDDAPVVDEPVDIDPQLARFLEGEGEVAKLHQAMSDNPNWGIAKGTEGYQLGQEFGGGIITGFNPNGSPILSGMATPDTLNALRDYVAGEGPIAEYLAQQEIDEAGQTYGDPNVAGTAPNRPYNPTLDPERYAQQGGGGGSAGGGGSPYFGSSPFGNLGGRILPGLERAAMTQPFRPLLGSLNQQALFPGVSPITQSLFQGALEDLALGGDLTPEQQRDIEQQELQLAERQGRLRDRETEFRTILRTDQARQIRERERQSYAAGINQMAQQEQERNRALALNVEGLTQSALGQDRQFGLGVGGLLGGLNLAGQELAQKGQMFGAEFGQREDQLAQDRINQARSYLLQSTSPFFQAAQFVNPMHTGNISGTTGLGLASNYQQMVEGRPGAGPTLFPDIDMSPFAQRNLMNQQQANMMGYQGAGDYWGGMGGLAGSIWGNPYRGGGGYGGGGGSAGGGGGLGRGIGSLIGGLFGPWGSMIGGAIGGGIQKRL